MRTRTGQAGQAAVLAALCMFTMIVFVALATNVGSLSSDRMRLQNTADAAALAGAYTQAGRMNQISQLNANIAYTAWYCRLRLTKRLGGETKIWNQCLYEPMGGDFPFDPPFGPGVDGPGEGPRRAVCHWRGGAPTGPRYDPDAEQLIDWCRQTMNGYRAQIAGINNYATNYRRPTPVSSGGGVRRAAYLTADANFFKSGGDEMQASQRTHIYDNVGSNTQEAFSPTWRDDGRYLPETVPRFLMPVSRSGDADLTDLDWIPSMVDLDIGVTSFRYFVTWCDSQFMNPPICTSLDAPRAIIPNSTEGKSLYSWYGKRTWPSPSGMGDVLYSVHFPVKVFGTPLKNFFDITDRPPSEGYFGATSMGGSDELSAYAVAKPYGGLIGPNRLIGDDRFDANWGSIPVQTSEPSSPVYGPASVQDLIAEGYFGASISVGPGGMSSTPQNQYSARLMGLGEEPMSDKGTGRLARPVELVGEAIRTRREPGRTDNLPPASGIDQYLLH